jgi:hypothetical protein
MKNLIISENGTAFVVKLADGVDINEEANKLGGVVYEGEVFEYSKWDGDTIVRDIEREESDKYMSLRGKRDRLLSESDWTQLPDVATNKDSWAVYRQALRDLPATVDIHNPVYPNKP